MSGGHRDVVALTIVAVLKEPSYRSVLEQVLGSVLVDHLPNTIHSDTTATGFTDRYVRWHPLRQVVDIAVAFGDELVDQWMPTPNHELHFTIDDHVTW